MRLALSEGEFSSYTGNGPRKLGMFYWMVANLGPFSFTAGFLSDFESCLQFFIFGLFESCLQFFFGIGIFEIHSNL